MSRTHTVYSAAKSVGSPGQSVVRQIETTIAAIRASTIGDERVARIAADTRNRPRRNYSSLEGRGDIRSEVRTSA
jgi:hypothetical protein